MAGNRKWNLKFIIGRLHLWLGLGSGVIIVFLGITGCFLAFEREIENLQPFRYVTAQDTPFLSPSVLKNSATAFLPGKQPHSVTYGKPGEAARLVYYNANPEYYYIIFINPYTAEVLKVKNMDDDFFRIVITGHYYLWLPPQIGQPILASATLIFLVMLISGIILWWPRNKAARKQRFRIKWNASFKRKNYDLHNVLGFYMSWIAIFLAITGLVMGFQWFSKSVYWISSGGKKAVEYYETSSAKGLKDSSVIAEDKAWLLSKQNLQQNETVEVHYAENDSAAIAVSSNPDAGTYWKVDTKYFNQYTMEEMPVTHIYGRFNNLTTADKIARMNYDIHVGAVLGLPGKILMFFASLIAASLPITGFLIWRGRRKRNKATAAPGAAAVI